MKPLEITDEEGDVLRIFEAKMSDDTIFLELCHNLFIINKEQSIQIINHLKQCFNI